MSLHQQTISMTTLYEQATAWLEQDPDIETSVELINMIARAKEGKEGAEDALAERFSGRLQFGTAGLRGKLQAGSMGMNRVLVLQAAAGLAAYLKANDSNPSVVIGYDGRKNSKIFAQDTAEIMAGAGVKALLLPREMPTPVLAYAIHHHDTTAGVMVTASHNPAQDNGYKVYLGKQHGGGQIVSPADIEIAKQIDIAAEGSVADLPRSNDYTVLGEEIVTAYVDATKGLAHAPACELNYVYTALHGVGKEVLVKTLTAANLPLPHIVKEQAEPDAAFPTVAFPNPEEKGALDLAIKLAKEQNAEFIIANDPDADRFAVAIPDSEGNWKPLTGNTVGLLLACFLGEAAQKAGKKGTFACSVVSSPALASVAERYGLDSAETLTGFKYIAKVPNLIYGYEESLGYLVDPQKVSDKDGISAAVVFLDLVRTLKAQGKTIAGYIEDFAREFGAYASGQVSIRAQELADLGKFTDSLRATPIQNIGGHAVVRSKDYMEGDEPNNILVYYFDNGSRLIVRPSGTEPKVKVYLDVKGDTAAQAEEVLAQFEADVREVLRSETYGKQDC
ncbi:phosphomannomutase [Neisseria perflava]|uniref:phospho-sugar mutase n=1 Tax=Neisseria perflava TaxID=33053 RepID=UPI00209F7EED|nr:phospho-sugar mutase [Neisseria perflava]MCP1771383.1 phosphomannomutase [Neisseria perflava]